MTVFRKVASAGLLASALALGGCVYDDYGYGGVSVGYGAGYPGYYNDYYGPYGYAPYGWYDGFYYPGNGYWLYDRYGNRHRWDDNHRRYWEDRQRHAGDWHGPRQQPWRPEYRNYRDNWTPPSSNPGAVYNSQSRALRDRNTEGYRSRYRNAPSAAPQGQPQVQQPQAQQPQAQQPPSNDRGNWRQGRGRRGD